MDYKYTWMVCNPKTGFVTGVESMGNVYWGRDPSIGMAFYFQTFEHAEERAEEPDDVIVLLCQR